MERVVEKLRKEIGNEDYKVSSESRFLGMSNS